MSKKGIILMLGAAIAAGFAGYKVGSKKHYCCLCDEPEIPDDEEFEVDDDEEDLDHSEAEKDARNIITNQMLDEILHHGKLPVFKKLDEEALEELVGKVRPELLAYIMCCGTND